MAAKKSTKTTEEITPVTELSFFQCQEIIQWIQDKAAENEGELTEEQLNDLVAANTQSIVKLKGLCNFLKLLESKILICKQRQKEVMESRKHAEDIMEKLGTRLAAWVDEQGKSYHCEEYELKSRRSTSVKLVDGFDSPFYCAIEMVKKVTPDKKAIKEALQSGEEIPGAELVEKHNLTIK
jgi:hypothetical protein